jgi:hypothetical protein
VLRYCILGAFVLACALYGIVWSFNHWHDPDRVVKLINFISVWYPFALSVFLAFIPDMDKSPAMRRAWRIGIIAGGFVYSLILWKQQSLTVDGARQDQQTMTTHTDQKIDGVKQEMKTGLKAVTDHSDERIAAVAKQVESTDAKLSGLFSKTAAGLGELGVSISKVGKPEPPIPASLVFSLWTDAPTDDSPIVVKSFHATKDGNYLVSFAVSNKSVTAAHQVDMWVDICDVCTFAKEPSGFDRPEGMREQTRHRMWPLLNSYTSTNKMEIEIKPKGELSDFEIGFRYSCEVCVKSPAQQKGTVLMLPYAADNKQ